MKTSRLFAICHLLFAICLVGCATNGGRQNAGREILGNKDTNSLSVTITRNFDPATGMLILEETTISNAVSVTERDKSSLGVRGFFANKAMKGATHSRTGFTGSTANTGVESLVDDVAEEAIKPITQFLSDGVLAYFSAGSSEVLKAIASARDVRELSPALVDQGLNEVAHDPVAPAAASGELNTLREALGR